jgi:hypothetical protein
MKQKQTERTKTPKLANREQLRDFLIRLETIHKEKDTKRERDQAIMHLLAQYKHSELQQLMGRAFVDALKSRSQKLGTVPSKTATRPKEDDGHDDGEEPSSEN